jgi:hypothetical protein
MKISTSIRCVLVSCFVVSLATVGCSAAPGPSSGGSQELEPSAGPTFTPNDQASKEVASATGVHPDAWGCSTVGCATCCYKQGYTGFYQVCGFVASTCYCGADGTTVNKSTAYQCNY